MPRKRKVKKGVKPQTLFRWLAYILIASVPIAVVIIGLPPSQTPRPESLWTKTLAQTTLPEVTTHSRPKTAAIIDQVAAYNTNEELITNVRSHLDHAGYAVDVFIGIQVTVELYRRLPSRGYSVIVLRVHSTATFELAPGQRTSGGPVFLLTGEPHNSLSYAYEQTMGRVRAVRIDAGTFFGIGPDFVAASMEGTFPDTIIILAGCESLANKDLAKALIARGASRIIGWSDSVSLIHNDKAILSLSRNLFVKKLSIPEAVQATMSEIGKDPDLQSFLLHYP